MDGIERSLGEVVAGTYPMSELRNIDLTSNVRVLIRASGIRTTRTFECTVRSSSTDSPLTLAQRSPDRHQHTSPGLLEILPSTGT